MVGVRKDEKRPTGNTRISLLNGSGCGTAISLHLNHVQAISVQTCPPRYVLCSTQLKYILNMYSGESAVGKSR